MPNFSATKHVVALPLAVKQDPEQGELVTPNLNLIIGDGRLGVKRCFDIRFDICVDRMEIAIGTAR